MDEEIVSTKEFFLSHEIRLSDLWLKDCINWYRKQNCSTSYTRETLYQQVYEQWLLLDLRDVEVPILPPNLISEKKIILKGNFHLQMMYIQDISRPKYWQLQKIRNKNDLVRLEQQENESFDSKRVLQLTLTDGVQEIQAIEYSFVSSLNVNLTPGIKVKIMGPVEVRRGQILLEERNIKVLGGEVEELVVPNAAENIIARKLGLPENNDPSIIQETFGTANKDILRNPTSGSNQTHPHDTIRNRDINPLNNMNGNHNATNKSNSQSGPNRNINSGNSSNSKQTNAFILTEEEEQRIVAEVEMLLDAERSLIEETSHRLGELKKENQSKQYSKHSSRCEDFTMRRESQLNNNSGISDFELEEDDIFENMDIDAHLDFVDAKFLRNEDKQSTETRKITSINEIKKQRDNIKNTKFIIKAKFKFVLDKLTVMNDKWHLNLLIGDDSDDLIINVHSDLITKLISISPSDMEAIKYNLSDKHVYNKVMKAIGDFKDLISNLNTEMEIEYSENETLPSIIDIKQN